MNQKWPFTVARETLDTLRIHRFRSAGCQQSRPAHNRHVLQVALSTQSLPVKMSELLRRFAQTKRQRCLQTLFCRVDENTRVAAFELGARLNSIGFLPDRGSPTRSRSMRLPMRSRTRKTTTRSCARAARANSKRAATRIWLPISAFDVCRYLHCDPEGCQFR